MSKTTYLDIAAGVLVDSQGRLLVARRLPTATSAGRWEFPGGKLEPGETLAACLERELAEEIGIRGCRARPVIRFAHDRGAYPVRLHIWTIDDWRGQPCGHEGQTIRWVTRAELAELDTLPGTRAIVNALDLARRYVITPGVAERGESAWWASLTQVLAAGARLIRLRDHGLDDSAYRSLAARVIPAAHAAGARVLLDRDAAMGVSLGADGLHWPARRLVENGLPEQERDKLVAVSAHGGRELAAAARIGADFAVLSPVAATPSHPPDQAMGWDRWAGERDDYGLPVYALGGLGAADIQRARAYNAQGVAAIRGFWPAGSGED